eukprot:sb/3478642/
MSDCHDYHEDCPKWKEWGECANNPKYMLLNCQLSCNACDPPTTEPPTTEEPDNQGVTFLTSNADPSKRAAIHFPPHHNLLQPLGAPSYIFCPAFLNPS